MRRIFIHSWHGDFAKTHLHSEVEYLGRRVRDSEGMLKLLTCGCDPLHLVRLRRPMWMRVLVTLRLYRCVNCGANVLRRPTGQRRAYPTAW